MALLFEFSEGWGPQSKVEIEDALRKCIGEPPDNETWVVSLTTGLTQQYCEVQIMTPNQTRTRLFFDEPKNLAKVIAEWIELYPLR